MAEDKCPHCGREDREITIKVNILPAGVNWEKIVEEDIVPVLEKLGHKNIKI